VISLKNLFMKKNFGISYNYLFSCIIPSCRYLFFINDNGQLAFDRHYNWVTDADMVCPTLNGLCKTSMQTEEKKKFGFSATNK